MERHDRWLQLIIHGPRREKTLFVTHKRQMCRQAGAPDQSGQHLQVSIIRKYHNHTLQTNPRHRDKEPQNNNYNKTTGRQSK